MVEEMSVEYILNMANKGTIVVSGILIYQSYFPLRDVNHVVIEPKDYQEKFNLFVKTGRILRKTIEHFISLITKIRFSFY